MSAQTLPSRKLFFEALLQGLIRAPLPILAGQVIVQTLEINEAGDLFSSLSLLSIVVFVGTLGLDRVFYHELGRAKVSGELAVARGMRRAAPIIMMLVSGICIALLIPAHFMVRQESMKPLMHFWMVLSLLPLFCLAKYLYGPLMTFGRPVLATMLSNTVPLIVVIIVMGIMMFSGAKDLFVWHAVVIYFFAYGLSVLAMYVVRSRCEPAEFRTGNREYHVGRWIARGSAQSVSVLSMVIMSQAAILYCSWVWSNEIDTAVLAVALQVGGAGWFLIAAASGFHIPAALEAIARKDRRMMRSLLRRWLIRIVPAAAISAIGILLACQWLLSLYGKDYSEASPIITVYAIGYAVYTVMLLPFSIAQYLNTRLLLPVIYGLVILTFVAMALVDETSPSAMFALGVIQVGFTILIGAAGILVGWWVCRGWPKTVPAEQ